VVWHLNGYAIEFLWIQLRIMPDDGQNVQEKTLILFRNRLSLWDRWYKLDFKNLIGRPACQMLHETPIYFNPYSISGQNQAA
jgi:hypothetical protein